MRVYLEHYNPLLSYWLTAEATRSSTCRLPSEGSTPSRQRQRLDAMPDLPKRRADPCGVKSPSHEVDGPELTFAPRIPEVCLRFADGQSEEGRR